MLALHDLGIWMFAWCNNYLLISLEPGICMKEIFGISIVIKQILTKYVFHAAS